MLPAKPVDHLASWSRATRLYVCEASLNALNRLHAFEQLLVGFGILDDDFGLPR